MEGDTCLDGRIIKPPALQPGDTIGIIAPSWCGPATFPHRVERGVDFLQSLGYTVVVAPHTFGRRGYLSGSPQERVADIHALFADPQVRAIISAIGGDHSCQLLPLLDWDLIRRNPKIVLGYSDMTVLNLAIHARTGLVTFNGPAVMTDLGEFPRPYPYTVDALQRVLTWVQAPGAVQAAREWTEEFQEWETQEDLRRPRTMQPSTGWVWLKGGRGEGQLLGGCLESMQHLRGTPYWPCFERAILFFETAEEVPSPEWVDGVLQDYENMDVLPRLQGLLIGRPYGYSHEQKREMVEVVLARTEQYDFPIVMDLDFGHTAPQMTLPIGCRAAIDVPRRRLTLIEAAVSPRGALTMGSRDEAAP